MKNYSLAKTTYYKILFMKHLFLLSAFLFFVNCTIAQQTFDPSGNDTIYIDIKNDDFSIQQVNESKFTIDLEIQVNYPKEVIDQLIGIGRYKIESTTSNRTFTLTSPSLLQIVTIGGNTLTENIKVNIKTPEMYSNNGISIAKSESMKTIKDPIDIVIRFVYPAPESSVIKGARRQ